MKTPRQYQESALSSLFDYLFQYEGHPLVVAPVGSGKSLLISEFIKRVHAQYSRTRIVMLSHVKELLEQDAEELISQYPECDFGFYCAAMKQKRLHNDVTFASIQSVHNKISDFNRCPEIIIIDECHLISHNDQTQYRKFIDSVLSINPNAKVIGFTGTPFRADTGRLDEGEGALFDGIAYQIDIEYMIKEGYLCRPKTPQITTKMDVSGVGKRGNDYIESQLQKAVNTDETTKACVKELIEHGTDRKKWLIFTAGIEHCENVAKEIESYGISCSIITGKTDKKERDDVISKYKKGEIRCLVNVAVLTTGFNDPAIDLLAFMRPTKSPVLYIQCIGRGIRTLYANGYDLNTTQGRLDAIKNSPKQDCMVLDFGGVIDELGPIDAVEIRKVNKIKKEKEETGDSPIKRCPSCGAICAPAQRYCYECSYAFISDSLDKKASNKAILSEDEPIIEHDVLDMNLTKHYKGRDERNTPVMKVSYITITGTFYDWVCFEHQGFAREKASAWHKKFCDLDLQPSSIDEALTWGYKSPSHIKVRKKGKYFEVIDHIFNKAHMEESNQDYNEFLDDEIPF